MQEQLPLWQDPEAELGRGCQPPGHFIQRELSKRGWSQADLAAVLKRPLPTVNEIIKAKRAVTPAMALALGQAFGNSAELWAHREAAYRLSLVPRGGDDDTQKKALLFESAPVIDLQRRGWIDRNAQTGAELEAALTKFFGDNPLIESNGPAALARQTSQATEFSNAQRAWLAQAGHLARRANVRPYTSARLLGALPNLRKLALKPELAANVPIALAELGVRFVVVEDLPRTKIDGAAFFLDDSEPVIAVSLRIDRMESFWHTLGHELRHILNLDPLSLDSDLVGESREHQVIEMERRADAEAADWLIPSSDLKSLILRTKPWFSKEALSLFASRMGIHPSIVIGQLQFRELIGWDRYPDLRPKIREHVVSTAICDGYRFYL